MLIYNSSSIVSSTHRQLDNLFISKSSKVVTKTCTLKPIEMFKKPIYQFYPEKRISVNNFHLRNPGFEYYKNYKKPVNKPYIISIAGSFEEILQMVNDPDSTADGYEINISCPNIVKNEFIVKNFTSRKPFGVKVSPYLTCEEIYILDELQPNWITCCNTIPSKEGGVSGIILRPHVESCIECLRGRYPNVKIVACGGIWSMEDVINYKKLGADEFQIGIALIENGLDLFEDFLKLTSKI